MKPKYLLLAVLLPLAANAWEPPKGYTFAAESANASYYVHLKSLKRKGHWVYAWVVSNNRIKTNAGWSDSARAYEVYDCKRQRSALISLAFFNTAGDIIESVREDKLDWEPIAPDSVAEGVYDIVCKRK